MVFILTIAQISILKEIEHYRYNKGFIPIEAYVM